MFWDLQNSPIPRHGSQAINFSSGTSLLLGVLAGLCGSELRTQSSPWCFFKHGCSYSDLTTQNHL